MRFYCVPYSPRVELRVYIFTKIFKVDVIFEEQLNKSIMYGIVFAACELKPRTKFSLLKSIGT